MESIKNYWAGENNGHKVLNRTATIGTVATLTAVAALTTLLLAAPQLNFLSHLASSTLFWPIYSITACGVTALPVGLFLFTLRSKTSLTETIIKDPKPPQQQTESEEESRTIDIPTDQPPSTETETKPTITPNSNPDSTLQPEKKKKKSIFPTFLQKSTNHEKLLQQFPSWLSDLLQKHHLDFIPIEANKLDWQKLKSEAKSPISVIHFDGRPALYLQLQVTHIPNIEFDKTSSIPEFVIEAIEQSNETTGKTPPRSDIPFTIPVCICKYGETWMLTSPSLVMLHRKVLSYTSMIFKGDSYQFYHSNEIEAEESQLWLETEIQDDLPKSKESSEFRTTNLHWILLRLLNHKPAQIRDWDENLYKGFDDEALGWWKVEFAPGTTRE